MASVGFLALLDDIATILDDVSVMTKLAAKKTAGVLGDDLALNAQQVSGVKASRELPVVWAVAKGSFVNKLILVPLALMISAFIPVLVTPLLMLGGLFLCYEGVEKLAHKWLPHKAEEEQLNREELAEAMADPSIDIAALERDKIKGAIRTDFILSAEIIVIALGAAQGSGIVTQTLVVSLIALVMTVGVYGLVAAIVKFDDAGIYLMKTANETGYGQFKDRVGRLILFIAPRFMRLLSIVGMLAMFLVGGGILVHGLPYLHHLIAMWTDGLGSWAAILLSLLLNGAVGVIAGIIVVAVVVGIKQLLPGTPRG